ncbi:MAG: hypothetical protein M4579_005772 [Chaenotheca gracillima]|nr:MAG: hypothetical protein M4579_005772 [Chaenotheca gracillima]
MSIKPQKRAGQHSTGSQLTGHVSPDSVSVLRSLRLDTLAKRGYLNLRCTWNQGCPSELELASLPDRHADEEFDTRTETAILYKASFKTLFPESDVPDVVAASCCSQFAVTKAKILERSKADYERYREWLLDTPLDDNYSGRVFEYSWHIIFGMPAKHCPDEQACYCDTFGLCDLRCTEKGCGWYKYPFGPDRSYFDRFKDWLGV